MTNEKIKAFWEAAISDIDLYAFFKKTLGEKSMIEINGENYGPEVLKSDIPVLMKFSATWCGPCRLVAKTLEDMSNELAGVKVVEVDVDDNSELAANFSVTSIPLLVLMKSGSEVGRLVGASSKSKILELIAPKEQVPPEAPAAPEIV